MRHFLYDAGFLPSEAFNVPVICIGNLELGGSGKTPMADYLISRFFQKYRIAFLSRGYGRSSSGFQWLENCTGPEDAGDEPWQLYLKWKSVAFFAVDENRLWGIRRILQEKPEVTLIVLDDAFQHRRVRAGFNLLLTPFYRPFFRNFLFPAGSLRDIPSAVRRVDAIVFSRAEIADETSLNSAKSSLTQAGFPGKEVFVSDLEYARPRNQAGSELDENTEVVCIAGLASNEVFFSYCHQHFRVIRIISLPDHFRYTVGFLKKNGLNGSETILCTEKDFAKITAVFPFPEKIFYLPLQIRVYPEVSFLRSLEKYLSA